MHEATQQDISNKTFDEIQIGESANVSRTLTYEDINVFAMASGDLNPTHLDFDYVHQQHENNKVTGHSMWNGALISGLLGTQLPGPGTIYKGQNLVFHNYLTLGDTVTLTITVKSKNHQDHSIIFDCLSTNQRGETVCTGVAEVIAPTEKIIRTAIALPELQINNPGAQLQRLVAMTHKYEPIRMAVVHPVDRNSLFGAIEAAKANLIIPYLVGPKAKIIAVAQEDGVDITGYNFVDTEHSHEAATVAVAMARSGEVDAIMKGSLHTDELMGAAVQRGTGIATARRMSHVFVLDVPSYPRPLFVTDAAINIDPTLEDKRDIVQNAIELAHALGVPQPKIALLSAVETINPKMRSTLEAAAICKMADRKQIVGGVIDGPLAFDNAVSMEAARIKGIISPVAGQADILVAPDLEAGNMVAKQLEYMAEAQSSGIVLGARVPIALTSRADSVLSRMASCALALLLVRNKAKVIP
ncbi:bifunctional enoyl-CoA hydratase/phosphate acetyltransferase [Beggiatoa leptomitoformis]|uniref:Bifunctional enoyl-CoA hydratase/phosphate acetyltransferase n=1 Tax=Beggiatoa leptomitoformis TaxID=288004 RepID=A0A2N9YFS6_9GAMM|nr:bifunctional enoyl-CoA hydratase/phosphate acetyltransferase [Beggiatoa leptomitoformis]ALG68448.1 bifunctional enoyl-CoA hydratase/phosphate acetyltransferase [Beggiatoa leptomitoformis]AUI69219.1 bifunctional enoyl-CoA hydratase/phosphate acetyltransferase [Beggiatoa leptomitoformis]